jgi:hypothetical protein
VVEFVLVDSLTYQGFLRLGGDTPRKDPPVTLVRPVMALVSQLPTRNLDPAAVPLAEVAAVLGRET